MYYISIKYMYISVTFIGGNVQSSRVQSAECEMLSVADNGALRSLEVDMKYLPSKYDNVLQSVKFCSDKITDLECECPISDSTPA